MNLNFTLLQTISKKSCIFGAIFDLPKRKDI